MPETFTTPLQLKPGEEQDMRKIVLNSLVATGLGFMTAGGFTAVAYQAPGGGGGAGQSQAPTPARTPDINGPMAGNNADSSSKVDDKKFVKDAAVGGMTEVELGKLATQKASSDAVKQFGQKMVDDHTKANEELRQIASHENINLPDSLDSKHQSRIDKLAKLSGPSFDKAYVKDAVKDHEKDVNAFQNEAQNGTDPNVKQFASKTLPVLQEHLSAVKDLNKQDKSK